MVKSSGTLLRGAVYLPGLEPAERYRERIASIKNKQGIINQLMQVEKALSLKHSIIDYEKLRLLCSHKSIRKKARVARMLGAIPAIIEEYPTYDSFIIEVDFL